MRSKATAYLRTYKYDFISLGLIFLAGLVPLIWLRHGMLVAYGDSGLSFFYNSKRVFDSLGFTWSNTGSTGVPGGSGITATLFYFLMAVLEEIGFSPVSKQRFLFCSLLILSGLGMYFLMLILQSEKKDRLVALLSSLFYMFNFFSMAYIWTSLYFSLFLLPLMPWALALWARGLASKRFSFALLINLLFLIFVSVFINPAFIIPFILFLFLFFLFHIVVNRKDKKEIWDSLKFFAITGFLGLFLNLWWILPLVQYAPFLKEWAERAAVDIIDSYKFMISVSDLASLLYVFRLTLSGNIFFDIFKSIYFLNIFIFISFLIPVLVLISPALMGNRKKLVLFFLATSIVALFFSKGLQPPLGWIFGWIFENVPGFLMFRYFFEKFGTVLMFSYAVLFGVGMGNINGILRKSCPSVVRGIFLSLLSVSILGAYVFPMWTGDVFLLPHGKVRSVVSPYVRVPSEYGEADRWLSQEKGDFRLISFPFIRVSWVAYRWENGFWGSNPVSLLLGKPAVNQLLGIPFNEINFMLPSLLLSQSDALLKVSSLLNARYVVLSNDVDLDYLEWETRWPQISLEVMRRALDRKEGISWERSFGKLDFYRIDERYWLPRFYVPEDVIYAQGDTESIAPILSFKDYKIKSAIFFQGAEQTSPDFILGKADHIFVTKHKLAVVDALKRVEEQFFVPQDGTYEIFVYDDTRIESLGKSLGIEVDGVQQQVVLPNSGVAGKDWVGLGAIRLTSGNHSIKITSQGLPINDVKINNNLVLHLERKQDKPDPPGISFRKINPTRYVVEVKGAASPYLLVFSESFNPAWRAYVVDKETGRRERIPDDRHFWVNGYANSWWVDKLGDYQIQVEFWPQRLVYWGAVISVITLIASVLYYFIDARRRRRHIS
ncbi:hypothetical protein HKBW3S43_01139 [Candidatus Hakubella thermalkaliphila]|uniref:Membrane protein YfhO n=1 Tax=Candidatus Hakubella thermalkaliphila TaxID=2754717 RepID=A0A6V8P0V1_9ACTN|nr:hypothetical protein [Candidatus Hakubella thermalkaliphila]GFP25091.1 hypothetical protein HKBW3S25_00541 [Candidatus Hakubella thermalkaliphila]GFP35347.1 hypothetical protein HKBW3S43_01139 [Candidatus Hakubella thermalkaliphila]